MIELRRVGKSFGASPILDAFDLRLETGKTTILIGPSGCGKSTLLRLMIGLVAPDTGSVRFEESEITPESVLRIRQRIGYVIQDGGLFPHLTARENVTLMARHLGWDPERVRGRVVELAELSRLPSDALGRYPSELSGGQKQRVALMRALMLDPPLLLLDEPLGALDPMIRFDLQTDLRTAFRSLGKTVVLVTHDIAEAGFLGDSLVLLREGRIAQRGTLEDLVLRPADPFVTQFVKAQRSPLESLVERGR